MKYIGIGLLFLLAVAAGFRKAAGIETRAKTLKNIRKDVQTLTMYIRTRKTDLKSIAAMLPEGAVRTGLLTGDSGAKAQSALTDDEQERLKAFLRTVSEGDGSEIESVGAAYLAELALSEKESSAACSNAKLFRAIGAICGAALAVLLW